MKRIHLLIGLVVIFLLAFTISGSVEGAIGGYTYSIVADILPGSPGSYPNSYTIFNDKAVFCCNGYHSRQGGVGL